MKEYEVNINTLKENLTKLEQKEKTNFTIHEIVEGCNLEIKDALKKGYSFLDICNAVFVPVGIKISPAQLKREYNILNPVRKKKVKGIINE